MVNLLAVGSTTWAIVGGVGVVLLGVGWFAARYWSSLGTGADTENVPTPTLDRINRDALSKIGDETPEEEAERLAAVEEEPAPDDLAAVVPDQDIVDHATKPGAPPRPTASGDKLR